MEPLNNVVNTPPSQGNNQQTKNTTIELKDIHLPEQINDYPIALGWWLLAAIFIAMFIFMLNKFFAAKKNNKSKKQALSQLTQVTPLSVKETMALLKWATMQYFPRKNVAALYGEKFKNYLSQTLPDKHQQNFKQLAQQGFEQVYQDNSAQHVDKSFNDAAILWLTHALPPKKRQGGPAA